MPHRNATDLRLFQSKIKEFRSTVIKLTGYRIDLPEAPPFNLYNVYPPTRQPTSQHVLTFRATKDSMEVCANRGRPPPPPQPLHPTTCTLL